MTTGVGPTIIQGPKGENGSYIHVNAGYPPQDLGVNGDLYIDNTTSNFYQKINGVWVFQGRLDTLYLEVDAAAAETTITHNFGRFPIVDVLEITLLSGSDAFTFDAFTRDAFDSVEARIRKPDDEYILQHPDRNTIIVQQGSAGPIKVILTA